MTEFIAASGIQRLIYFSGVAKILLDTDRNTRQVFNGIGVQTLNIVPDGVIPMPPNGMAVDVIREGAGSVVIQAAPTVTLNGVLGGSATLSTQYQFGFLVNRGVDNWIFATSGSGGSSQLSPVQVPFVYTDTTVAAYALPANKVLYGVKTVITTAFDGTSPSVEVGIAGDLDKFMTPAQNILNAAGSSETAPAYIDPSPTNIVLTVNGGGGPTSGAGLLLLFVQT